MRCILNDLRRGIINRAFLVAVLLQILLLYFGGREDWPYYAGLDGFYLFAASRELSVTHLYFPIIVCLPFALSFASDMRQGFIFSELHRSGRARYITARIMANTIAGALAVGLGTAIYALACILLSQPSSYRVEVWRTYADGNWLEPFLRTNYGRPYMLLCIILDMMGGAVWATVCLALSTIYPNPIFSLLGTQIIYLAFVRIPPFSTLINPIPLIRPTFFNSALTLKGIIARQLFCYMVFLGMSIWGLYKALKNIAVYNKGLLQVFSPFWVRSRKGKATSSNWLSRCFGGMLHPTFLLVAGCLILIRPFVFRVEKGSMAMSLLSLIGGIPYQDIPSVGDIAAWMLLLMPCLLGVGLQLQQEFTGRMYFTLYRYRSGAKWFLSVFRSNAIVCIGYGMFQALWIIIWCYINRIGGWDAWGYDFSGTWINAQGVWPWVVPMLCIHLVLIAVVQMVIHIASGSGIAAIGGALLVWISTVWFGSTPSAISSFLPGNIGMVLRSSNYGSLYGSPALQFLTQIVLTIILVYTGSIISQKMQNCLHMKVRNVK